MPITSSSPCVVKLVALLTRGRRVDLPLSTGPRLAVLLLAGLLATACATPIGLTSGDIQTVHRALTQSVLSTGRPSGATEQVLQRFGLAERFEKEPEAALAQLRGTGAGIGRGRLFALAELSFLHAERTHKQDHYLAAAVYAYAFMLEGTRAQAPGIDPRTRLAADLYDLGVALGLAAPRPAAEADPAPGGRPAIEPTEVVLTDRTLPLPFGELELRGNPEQLRWGGFRMSRFVWLGKYEIRGIRNHYRQAGIGAPLAAEVTPAESGADAEIDWKHIAPRTKVPVTAVVRFENVVQAIADGKVRGRLEIFAADEAKTIEIEGRTLPLELQPTATLAYQLEGAPVWDSELGAFFSADFKLFGNGLIMMHPYRPGRIPVVLIHGTASSPARWAEIVNEVQNDPTLRERIQFWLFTYNTSNPILLSASQLRRALQDIQKELDPEGRDPALRRMVLIGHSQGGLLARLMVTDSGTRFWDNLSHVPFSEIKASPATRELIQNTMFFEPVPSVSEVVFMCTPHRGSFRVSTLVLSLVRRLVTLPLSAMQELGEFARLNPDAISLKAVGDLPNAVDSMSPDSRFIRALSASAIASGVTVHSIVAVLGDGPVSGQTDGVVAYESAHLDGVASEKVVRSGHSAQANPETVLEVVRILREHVERQ
jgi:pimeloyl-ACP methyl ester carboxylesterase